MTNVVQKRVFITGQVQGVGFRSATYKAARAFPSLMGFVRNLPDGRVEAVFSGNLEAVLSMISWCRHGHPSPGPVELEIIDEPVDNKLQLFKVV